MYAKDSKYLVISGIGKTNAAAATAHALSRLPNNSCALNMGIAGSDNPIGTLFRASCITNRVNDSITNDGPHKQQSLYPPQIFRQHPPGISVCTVDQPSINYCESEAFDMEAHAFCTTARRYLTAELVQSLKIISDNPQTPLLQENSDEQTFKINKQFVTDLVENNISDINSYASELVESARSLPANSQVHASTGTSISSSELTRLFIQHMHFTESEQRMLNDILNRYAVLKRPVPYLSFDDDGIVESDFESAKPAANLPGNAAALLKELQCTLHHQYPDYIEY